MTPQAYCAIMLYGLLQNMKKTIAEYLQVGELPKAQRNHENSYAKEKARSKTPQLLIDVIVENSIGQKVNFNKQIENDFEYNAQTGDLEFDTQRTTFFENYLNKAIEGSDIKKIKLYIIKKSKQKNSFVYPDGSFFITQEAINNLGTVDRVCAVLIHEIEGHLKNKTFEKKVKAGRLFEFGIGWLHEGVSDGVTKPTLEKLGLNSAALGEAIEIIGGEGRGLIHQHKSMRASQNFVHHMVEHSLTSHKKQTPLPDWMYQETEHCDLEKINAFFEYDIHFGTTEEKLKKFKAIATNLHPRDLLEATELLKYGKTKDNEDIFDQAYLSTKQDQIQKLESEGYLDYEINLFVILFLEDKKGDALKNEDALFEIIDNTPSIYAKDSIGKMYELLYKDSKYFGKDELIYDKLVNYIVKHTYGDQSRKKTFGVYITSNNFPILIEKIIENYHNMSVISEFISSYVFDAYLYKNRFEDKQADIELLFAKIKKLGFTLSWRTAIDKTFIKNKLNLEDDDPNITDTNISQLNQSFNRAFCLKEQPENLATIEKIEETFLGGVSNISSAINMCEEYCEVNKLDSNSKLELIEKAFNLIDKTEYYLSFDLVEMLNNNNKAIPFDPDGIDKIFWQRKFVDKAQNEKPLKEGIIAIRNCELIKLTAKLSTITELCPRNSNNYFILIDKAINESGFDLNELNLGGLRYIASPILAGLGNNYFNCFSTFTNGSFIPLSSRTLNYGKKAREINQLPQTDLFKIIINKTEAITIADLEQLLEIITDYRHFKRNASHEPRIDTSIFRDDPFSLIFESFLRKSLITILEGDIAPSEYSTLAEVIDKSMPKSVNKDILISKIHRKYLKSQEIELYDKIEHLVNNFDNLGYEEVIIVAEQITKFEDYKYFRTKLGGKLSQYLDGSMRLNFIAGADLISSHFSQEHTYLLSTAMPDNKEELNNNIAKLWIEKIIEIMRSSESIILKNGKIHLDQLGRELFITLNDAYTKLKNLSNDKKFILVLKSLIDEKGALSDSHWFGRSSLAGYINRIFGSDDEFVNKIIEGACNYCDAKVLSIPAANLLAPLLFRSLDVECIDIDKLLDIKVYYRGEHIKVADVFDKDTLLKLIKSPTREAVSFGKNIQEESQMGKIAQNSHDDYRLALSLLENKFNTNESDDDIASDYKTDNYIDSNNKTEAIASALETNALGVRAMQSSAMLCDLDKGMEKRFSSAFDRNKGMNGLVFWENIYKLHKDDEKIKEFIDNQLLEINKYIGGGSLQTTRAAKVLVDKNSKDAVLKMLNPNPEYLITAFYDNVRKVLTSIIQNNEGELKEKAITSFIMVWIAYNWCMKDVNDQLYEIFDNIYEEWLKENEHLADSNLELSEKYFTSKHIKSEERAKGVTINTLLEDNSIDADKKKEAVLLMGKLLYSEIYQTNNKPSYLMRSDPNPGNLIITLDNKPVIIDRTYYLDLDEKDLEIGKMIIENKNGLLILNKFIQRLFEINNIENRLNKSKITATTLLNSLHGISGINDIKKKQGVSGLSEIIWHLTQKYQLHIPNRLLKMIINIISTKKILAKYDYSYDDCKN